ncbi:RagB/SusD family nutrient uptake outer membrane protein [uncultured Muribaculum sp.]|uniref:RagB/SusD family nutrient uptake outer membrane protein n=1 Tax=uncultured Muribaculum sp. TaxID=1918613 RepID=UPI0025D704B7|nr:RagB/SusD family nutrient uptake outer membrane protein [uncultured Muribaculum sp.]
MKTNIFRYIAFGAAALSLSACEDFLDVSPDSSITNDDIFSSEDETKAMLNTVYTKLTANNLYGLAWPYTFNTNTDVEMKSNGNQFSTSGNGDEVHCFDMRSLWGSLESTWNSAYEAVNYCNDFIENMQDSPLFSAEVSGTPSQMQHMYGEAKCLRAMIYLDLIRTWGDVPYRTESTKVGIDFYGEGVTDRNVILENLVNDLIGVEDMMLPAADLTEGVERASREYCQALIGQLCLYRGGYALRPGGSEGVMSRADDYLDWYRTAKTYLGRVISEGRHSLDRESFAEMWARECRWQVLRDGDMIFEIPMRKDGNGSYGYNIGVTIGFNEDHPAHPYGQATNRISYCGLYPFTFDQRDLRLDVTCVPYKYDEDLNQEVDLGKSCVSGWGVGKWNKMNMDLGNMMSGTAGSTGINAVRMRYADVLLMYAEAENELNGPTADAKEALKKVRRRAFDPSLHAEMVEAYVEGLAGPEAFFNAIVNERAWEFGGEGIRKYDLARWNKYSETLIKVYKTLVDWGKRAWGDGARGDVRDRIYIRETTDANGRIRLEFRGLKEYGPDIDHPVSEGWKKTQDYAMNWQVRNKETEQLEIHDDVKWSFRGFINFSNESSVTPATPVRYLCPYPGRIITTHKGSIQQQYGYR